MNQQNNIEDVFYYPENLTEKTTFFGWTWFHAAVVGVSLALSVVMLAYMGLFIPLLFTVLYAICTFSVNDCSVYQFLLIYIRYFFTDQLIYLWREDENEWQKKTQVQKS